MPLPMPKKGEAQDTFIERCMGNPTMKSEFPDNKQRLAVCHAQWKKRSTAFAGADRLMDRRYLSEGAEVRVADDDDEDKRTITGYAAVFNAEALIMPGFREVVRPGAFKKTLREADIRALMNHEPSLILGRKSAGTLKAWEDEKGLGYRIQPPDTSYAHDLLVSIRRGDVTQSSFGFRVIKDRWTENTEEKTLLRELLEVKLFDVSPVTFPAYPQTEVHVRTLLDGLLRKADAGHEIDEEERAAVLAALDLLKDSFLFEPGPPHSTPRAEEPGPPHSDEAIERDLAALRRRLDLKAKA
jgi:uncharacterized protein